MDPAQSDSHSDMKTGVLGAFTLKSSRHLIVIFAGLHLFSTLLYSAIARPGGQHIYKRLQMHGGLSGLNDKSHLMKTELPNFALISHRSMAVVTRF